MFLKTLILINQTIVFDQPLGVLRLTMAYSQRPIVVLFETGVSAGPQRIILSEDKGETFVQVHERGLTGKSY